MRAPLTLILLLLNLAAFALEMRSGDAFVTQYALWPYGRGFAPLQLLSSGFLHANLLHLGSNMLGLWMFGREVERALGSTRFALLYFASLLSAALTQLLVVSGMAETTPTVGASGAVFGVLMAFAMLFPRRIIVLLFPPIPMPAWLFVLLYAAFELYAGVHGTFSGVAHFAHLGGLLGAWLLMRGWRRRVVRSWY
ncbi:Membrane associated serine protease, rhomboid family [Solimonas aquatica]|uniref:Membrane associated serine protease, rhomboid family n=1 Tax=Solimonas aquatica TaxID=489703 RepID=A0A1H9LVN0_9GAMM|nr:rhomboid family intramembrane serine protease [Solimonas aquatica]SER15542.1 Membrane associated serine protease, rhomboid family [Solimonas aquatica]